MLPLGQLCNMTNHYPDITKKQFKLQLMVLPHKQTLVFRGFVEEKYFKIFEEET